MMHSIAATAGTALYKRAAESGYAEDPNKPNGRLFVMLLIDCLIFLPAIVYMSYTLGQLFPVLAIVENVDPPAYEPVALSEPADGAHAESGTGAGKPISSSLRALGRLLYSVGGWRSSFRGFGAFLAYIFAEVIVTAIICAIPFVPAEVATLVASLALVQLSAAWLHVAISTPNSAYFWRRLPPFRKAFAATWIPTVTAWAAGTALGYVPLLTAYVVGLPLVDPSKPDNKVPEYDRDAIWKLLVVLLVALAAWVLVLVPAEVLLVRVQASLLPPDEDTIIPFDRTYDGTLEPAVVGKGYVSVRDALKTFPRASWVRIYVLHAKIFAVVLMAYGLMVVFLLPQAVLLKR